MNIIIFHIISAILTIILGTLLHFTYNFSHNNKIVGLFSATDESTFEHLKLIFFPMLLFSIIEYFIYGHNLSNFISVRCICIILGMFLIVSQFYTYSGVIGKNYGILNIIIFIVSVLLAYLLSLNLLNTTFLSSLYDNIIAAVILVLLTFSFCLFTYSKPQIGLFKAP